MYRPWQGKRLQIVSDRTYFVSILVSHNTYNVTDLGRFIGTVLTATKPWLHSFPQDNTHS